METQRDNALTVSQLTALIKNLLEGSFNNIILKGEISNFTASAAGHLYFSLKDSDAQISAVMFRGSASSLNFKPKDGMLVQAKGKVSVYAPRGNYQVIVSSMIRAGAGDIMEMIEERKRKLAAEGLFDRARKRPLPFFPRTVGVVTSPTGAALRDILNIRRRRNDKVGVVIFPALVQGAGAAEAIARMIETANKHEMCDVLIVGRGGGSLEDLLPFSEELVVRAVAASRIPTISAVGHDIDWALSDFAADARAPTPSAAAEIAIPERAALEETISIRKGELFDGIRSQTRNLRLLLKSFNAESMRTQLENIEQRLSERFDRAMDSLNSGMKDAVSERRRRIELCAQTLENCNPQTVFNRGYSMVRDEATGRIITSAAEISAGAKIIIRPAEGEISATVTSTRGGKQ